MENDCMKHGAFSWSELMTTDVEGAKNFYSELFGWKFKTSPMPGFDYIEIEVNGKSVAGLMAQPDECKGYTPSWDSYVTVDDVDATASKVTELGGKVLRAPADIPEVGRFCVLQDPQGAVLMAITFFRK